jgi:hypothetical protein
MRQIRAYANAGANGATAETADPRADKVEIPKN